jgi:uncharacterized membrane protein
MYRIIGADQKEYGPVSADQVRQWIAEGRASGASLVRPEGATEWQPLSVFADFAGALAGAAPAVSSSFAHSQHTGLSQEILARDYDLDIGSCIGNSWNLLKTNFGMIFGGAAIYLLVQGGIVLLSQIPIVGILLTLVNLVVAGPLLGGLYLFMLKNIRHQAADIGDIFSGFRISFGQLILGHIVTSILTALSAIPGVALVAYPAILMAQHNAVSGPLILLGIVGFVLAFVPMIYLSVGWIFTLALIIDRQMDFWPAMEASRKVVGRHWGAVFALLVVCGLINVAGFFACCVGTFITLPISIGAMMYAYESIFSAAGAPTA